MLNSIARSPNTPVKGRSTKNTNVYLSHNCQNCPSKLARYPSLGRADSSDPPLRASNEGLPRTRVARAQETFRPSHSFLHTFSSPFLSRGAWIGSSPRASSDRSFIVGALRARRAPGRSFFPFFFVCFSSLAERPGLVPHRVYLIIGQTFLHFSLNGRASVVVLLRPSSEHILIVRAPGAVDHTGFPIDPFPSRGRPG